MAYSKPKVTIDLDEYNALKELEANFDKKLQEQNEDVDPYKLALEGIVERMNGQRDYIMQAVSMKDVVMHISNTQGMFVEVHCRMKNL